MKENKPNMKLNIMAFVMMIVAIAVGKIAGGFLLDVVGGTIGGTIIGTLVVGFVCYIIYNLVTRGKFNLTSGLLFAVLVFVAELVAGYAGSYLALGTGDLILYAITGAIMAILWSWIGGKSASGSKRGKLF